MDEDIENFLRRVAVQPPPNASALMQRQGSLGMAQFTSPTYSSGTLGGSGGGMGKMNMGGGSSNYMPSPSASPVGGWVGAGNPAAEPTLIPGQMSQPMGDMTLIPGQNTNDFASRNVIVTFQSNDPFFPTAQREVAKSLQIGRKMENQGDSDPSFIGYDTKVVSRKHAELLLQNGEVFLKDLGSQAGTFLNNARLSPAGNMSNPIKLSSGDIVQFGTDFRDRNVKEQRAVLVTVQLAPGRPTMGGGGGGQPFTMASNPAYAALSNQGRKSSLTSLEDLRPYAASQSPPSGGSRPSMVFGSGANAMARASIAQPSSLQGAPIANGGMVRSPSNQGIGGAPNLANLTMIGGAIKR